MSTSRKSTCRCGWPAFLLVTTSGFALTGEFWQSMCVAIAVTAIIAIGVRLGLWARVFHRRPACYTLPSEVRVERESMPGQSAPTQADIVRSWLMLF